MDRVSAKLRTHGLFYICCKFKIILLLFDTNLLIYCDCGFKKP